MSSILLYILTFICGIGIDYMDTDKSTTKVFRYAYILWLFIFLCFGYMTGSDWRNYEIMYQDIMEYGLEFNTEIGFYFIYYICSLLFSDFFVTLALLKIIFLCTLIHLVKHFTSYWLSAITILFPISLLFLLVDNPLRYMLALAFFNISLLSLMHKKNLLFALCAIMAVLCHNSAVCCYGFILIFLYADKLYKLPNWVLLLAYGISFALALSTQYVYHWLTQIVEMASNALGTSHYAENYLEEITEPTSVLQLGYLINFCIFLFLLWAKSQTRFKFFTTHPWSKQIFALASSFFILQPISSAVPICYRLIIPGGFFVAIIIAELIRDDTFIRWGFTVYFLAVMIKNIWFHFTYIPYTNSIPYIITQNHLSYEERYNNNLNDYQQRFNEEFESFWR